MTGDVDGHWHLEEKGPAGIEDAKSRQKTHSGTSEKGNMYYFNDRMIGVKKLLTEFQTIKWGRIVLDALRRTDNGGSLRSMGPFVAS